MGSEQLLANGERQTSFLSADALKEEPTPASDYTMEQPKKPSVWKRMADKLGLNAPLVIMMAKYVAPRSGQPR
jgi:hypothetical protein